LRGIANNCVNDLTPLLGTPEIGLSRSEPEERFSTVDSIQFRVEYILTLSDATISEPKADTFA
jgi:hypothetical protein